MYDINNENTLTWTLAM